MRLRNHLHHLHLLLLLIPNTIHAFAPNSSGGGVGIGSFNHISSSFIASSRSGSSSRAVLPPSIATDVNVLSDAVVGAATAATTTSTNMMDFLGGEMTTLNLSAMDSESMFQTAKSVVIVLLFGGGLIPAAISANKSLIGTLAGKRRGGEEGSTAEYITNSGATGPPLPNSALLFASESIPLVDIIAIMGRITDVNSIADWNNLPTAKLETANPSKPILWLPRKTFKENIRRAKFKGWPTDPNTGLPVGGVELEAAEKARISKPNAIIGDAALDAAFDTWAWGASVATPDKVGQTLKVYRGVGSGKGENTLDLDEFVKAAIRGRAVTGLGALSFIIIQVVAYGTLFIAPALRVLFDLDVGFGQLGSCSGDCASLF